MISRKIYGVYSMFSEEKNQQEKKEMNNLQSSYLASRIFAKINASSYLSCRKDCLEPLSDGHSTIAPPVFSQETIKLYRASTLDLYQFYLGTYTSLDQLNLKHPEFWKGREQALSKLATVKSHISEWWNGIFNPVNNLPLRLRDHGKTDVLSCMKIVSENIEAVLLSPEKKCVENLKRNFKLLKFAVSEDAIKAENLLDKLRLSKEYFIGDTKEMDRVSKEMFNITPQYEKRINDLQQKIDSCNREIAIGIGVTVTGGVFILVGVVGAFFSGGASLALLVPGIGMTTAGAIVIAMAQKEKNVLEAMKSDYSDDKTAIAALAGRLKNICSQQAGSLTKDFENIVTPWKQMDAYLEAVMQEAEDLGNNNDPQKWKEIQSTFESVKKGWMEYLEELPKLHFDVSVASVSVNPQSSQAEVEKMLSEARIIPLSEWHAA